MKSLSILFLIILGFTACDKDGVSQAIIGTWKLKSSYMDPGDGSGKYQDVPSTPAQTINFKEDGSVAINNLISFDYSSYFIGSDSTITFISKGSSNNIAMRYSIKGNLLTLNPPCFEGCGFRFQKTQ